MTSPKLVPARRASRLPRKLFLIAALAAAGLVPPAGAQSSAAAPSPEVMRGRVERMIANTHRNDAAIEEYERVERWIERRGEKDPQVRLDKTYRVVPTGTGTLKVILKENGQAVAPEY